MSSNMNARALSIAGPFTVEEANDFLAASERRRFLDWKITEVGIFILYAE